MASRRVTTTLVGSYPTVSPLPPASPESRPPEAVSFLCHFPSAFAAWGFPSVLPFGVRTFLGVHAPRDHPACARNCSRARSGPGPAVTVAGSTWECWWTLFLAQGHVTVQGPFYDKKNSVLAMTGGTGVYADAHGWMELRSKAFGTKYDFVYHVS